MKGLSGSCYGRKGRLKGPYLSFQDSLWQSYGSVEASGVCVCVCVFSCFLGISEMVVGGKMGGRGRKDGGG